MSSSSPPPQSPCPPPATAITDLNEDTLAHCAAYLNPRDLSNLAMTCTSLKRLAYSDSIWLRLIREHWHHEVPCSSLNSSGARARDLYLARRTALQQFKFLDPLVVDFYRPPVPLFNHLLLHKNMLYSAQGQFGPWVPPYMYGPAATDQFVREIFLPPYWGCCYYLSSETFLGAPIPRKGSLVETIDLDKYQKGTAGAVNTLGHHKAKITCMRLFSSNEISLSRGETEKDQNLLVTSSCDHTIRLWGKGSRMRSLRGHNGPVLSLSDKLLGEDGCKILASGGEDGTVRLWSLGSSGNQGQRALKATFYGHEKPVNLMSVAGHKTSLLVTISRDAKVRVWDTATSSAARSSCCVGMTSVPGAPVNLKCHESLLYTAAGSSVTAVDLRTMQKVITAAVHQPKLYSFDIVPSKSLICTGGDGRAMLWDIRRNQEALKPEPVAELDEEHRGQITLLHMDPYKIVTGGPDYSYVNVWEADTGAIVTSLLCWENNDVRFGCDAMAVDGFRIVTARTSEEGGILRFRDFKNATSPLTKLENNSPSKFWDSPSGDDSDDSDDDR